MADTSLSVPQQLKLFILSSDKAEGEKFAHSIKQSGNSLEFLILTKGEKIDSLSLDSEDSYLVVDLNRIKSLSNRPENLINNILSKVTLNKFEVGIPSYEEKGLLNKIKVGLFSVFKGLEKGLAGSPFLLLPKGLLSDFVESIKPSHRSFIPDLVRFCEKLNCPFKRIKLKGISIAKEKVRISLIDKLKFRINLGR